MPLSGLAKFGAFLLFGHSGVPYRFPPGELHPGLPANDLFRTALVRDWTQKRLWADENIPADHALK